MLATEQYKIDLKDALKSSRDNELNEEQALDVFVAKQAEALERYLKTLTVMYSAGLMAGSVPVTGVLNHTIQ